MLALSFKMAVEAAILGPHILAIETLQSARHISEILQSNFLKLCQVSMPYPTNPRPSDKGLKSPGPPQAPPKFFSCKERKENSSDFDNIHSSRRFRRFGRKKKKSGTLLDSEIFPTFSDSAISAHIPLHKVFKH